MSDIIQFASNILTKSEKHTPNSNFNGPFTKFEDRLNLEYKGNVGAKLPHIPYDILDIIAFNHDLGFTSKNEKIRIEADQEYTQQVNDLPNFLNFLKDQGVIKQASINKILANSSLKRFISLNAIEGRKLFGKTKDLFFPSDEVPPEVFNNKQNAFKAYLKYMASIGTVNEFGRFITFKKPPLNQTIKKFNNFIEKANIYIDSLNENIKPLKKFENTPQKTDLLLPPTLIKRKLIETEPTKQDLLKEVDDVKNEIDSINTLILKMNSEIMILKSDKKRANAQTRISINKEIKKRKQIIEDSLDRIIEISDDVDIIKSVNKGLGNVVNTSIFANLDPLIQNLLEDSTRPALNSAESQKQESTAFQRFGNPESKRIDLTEQLTENNISDIDISEMSIDADKVDRAFDNFLDSKIPDADTDIDKLNKLELKALINKINDHTGFSSIRGVPGVRKKLLDKFTLKKPKTKVLLTDQIFNKRDNILAQTGDKPATPGSDLEKDVEELKDKKTLRALLDPLEKKAIKSKEDLDSVLSEIKNAEDVKNRNVAGSGNPKGKVADFLNRLANKLSISEGISKIAPSQNANISQQIIDNQRNINKIINTFEIEQARGEGPLTQEEAKKESKRERRSRINTLRTSKKQEISDRRVKLIKDKEEAFLINSEKFKNNLKSQNHFGIKKDFEDYVKSIDKNNVDLLGGRPGEIEKIFAEITSRTNKRQFHQITDKELFDMLRGDNPELKDILVRLDDKHTEIKDKVNTDFNKLKDLAKDVFKDDEFQKFKNKLKKDLEKKEAQTLNQIDAEQAEDQKEEDRLSPTRQLTDNIARLNTRKDKLKDKLARTPPQDVLKRDEIKSKIKSISEEIEETEKELQKQQESPETIAEREVKDKADKFIALEKQKKLPPGVTLEDIDPEIRQKIQKTKPNVEKNRVSREGLLKPSFGLQATESNVEEALNKSRTEQMRDLKNWEVFDMILEGEGNLGNADDNPLVRQNKQHTNLMLKGDFWANNYNYPWSEDFWAMKQILEFDGKETKESIKEMNFSGNGVYMNSKNGVKEKSIFNKNQFIEKFDVGDNSLIDDIQTNEEYNAFKPNIIESDMIYQDTPYQEFSSIMNTGILETDFGKNVLLMVEP